MFKPGLFHPRYARELLFLFQRMATDVKNDTIHADAAVATTAAGSGDADVASAPAGSDSAATATTEKKADSATPPLTLYSVTDVGKRLSCKYLGRNAEQPRVDLRTLTGVMGFASLSMSEIEKRLRMREDKSSQELVVRLQSALDELVKQGWMRTNHA